MSQAKTKFEKFEIAQVPRSQLVKAEYNPRKIKTDNKKRLKERIQKVGLLEPIVWNKQTGNIVSGHQRIEIMDSLNKSKDYILTVAVVDLDPTTEKEQSMFFNNMSAMGEWDLDKLADLFEEEVNMVSAGFSKRDMESLFDMDPAEVFSDTLASAEAPPLVSQREPVDNIDNDVQPETFEGDEPDIGTSEEIDHFSQGDKVREGMQHRKRRAAVSGFREDTDFYFVAVFKSKPERDQFLADYNIEESQFINGNVLREAIEHGDTYE